MLIQPPIIGGSSGQSGSTPVPPILSVPSQQPLAAPSPQTPVGAAAAPVLIGEYDVVESPAAPEVAATSNKVSWVAAVLGALVLLGGGGFFALTAFGASGGAETPEIAVDAMIEALNNEDFVTLAEMIEPSERRTIVEPVIAEVLPELVRLGIFSEEIDAGDVEGVDWEFTDVEYRVESLAQNPDMVHVFFTGGEVATQFSADEFPMGDLIRDQLGDDVEDDERQVEELEDGDDPLTFVQRDGRWYFSGLFTMAEAARLEVGERLPRMSESPATLGSESPEAAVEAMIAEFVEFDLEGLIGRMDPEEMAVLYRYSPLFLEEAQRELDDYEAELRAENYRWSVEDLDFDVESNGDDAVVRINGFTLDVVADDIEFSIVYSRDEISARGTELETELGGSFALTTTSLTLEFDEASGNVSASVELDPETGTFTFSANDGDFIEGSLVLDPDGECSRYETSSDESGCLEELLPGSLDASGAFGVLDVWPTQFPGLPVSARRTNGEWYISPIGTAFDGYLGVLGAFEEEQFQQIATSTNDFNVDQAIDEVFAEAFGVGGNELVFEPIDEPEDFFEDDLDDFDPEDFFEDDFDDFDPEDFFDDEFVEVARTQDSVIGLEVELDAVLNADNSIERGQFDLGIIELVAGDTVILTVETDSTSSLDPTVGLFDSVGNEVAFNDDAGFESGLDNGFDSQLEVTVNETGTYYIEIGSYQDASGGSYTVTAERR